MASFTATKTGWTSTLNVNQTSQNIDNNTSIVSWNISTTAKSGYSAYNRYTGKGARVTVRINGQVVHDTTHTYTINSGQTKQWASGTYTVPHNSDGTKTVSVSFTISDPGVSVFDSNGGGNLTLTTIPRTTVPTFNKSEVVLGDSVLITLPRASANFTHNIDFKYGNNAFTRIVTGATTSYSWSPQLNLATYFPSSTKGIFLIRVRTMNGNAEIGFRDYNITLSAPSSMIPTITQTVSQTGTSLSVYVQGYSKARVSVSGAGVYNSTIVSTSTSIKVGNTVIQSSNSSNFESGILSQATTYSIISTVTDSRGRTASKTTNITVQAYERPKINNIKTYRSTTTGLAKDDEANMTVGGTPVITSLSGNSFTYKVEYKEKESATSYNQAFSVNANNVHKVVTLPASLEKEWEVKHTITDRITSVVITRWITSDILTLDFHSSGQGIAFGKVANTANLFEISDNWSLKGGKVNDLIDENLNDVTRTGVYLQSLNAGATTAKNYPENKAGYLEVYSRSDKNYILQRYTTIDNSRIYQRARYLYSGASNDGWYAWRLTWGVLDRRAEIRIISPAVNTLICKQQGNVVHLRFYIDMSKVGPSYEELLELPYNIGTYQSGSVSNRYSSASPREAFVFIHERKVQIQYGGLTQKNGSLVCSFTYMV